MTVTGSQSMRRLSAFLLAALLLAACGGSDEPATQSSDDGASTVSDNQPSASATDSTTETEAPASASDPARIEAAEWLATSVPESAQDFRFQVLAEGIDDAAIMRFDLPVADFDPFVASLNLGRELSPGRHGFQPQPDPEWLVTSELTDFVGAPSTGRFPVVQLTADVSAADIVTVYILSFEV